MKDTLCKVSANAPHLKPDVDTVLSVLASNTSHAAQIALMKFLSRASKVLGIAEHVYVVGGAVRNFVIDQPIKDIDVVIDSVRAGMDSDAFALHLQGMIPAETSLATNNYGVAILSVKGEWFLDGHDLGGEVLEIANARTESYGGDSGKGYKPSEVNRSTIEEDVRRREFSFNTLLWQMSELAEGPDKAQILDLTGCGVQDLKDGVMRCPSDPDKTFKDDPTRMMRAVKFMVKYGFKIAPDVSKAIRRNARRLKDVPHAAVAAILIRDILQQSQSKRILLTLKDLGLLEVVAGMVRENPAFRATLSNFMRDVKVLFLLDMMDLGVPLATSVDFLSPAQRQRLRVVALEMPEGDPEQFVDLLKQPGKLVDMSRLINVKGLKGAEIRNLTEQLRELLLQDPTLRFSAQELERAAIRF